MLGHPNNWQGKSQEKYRQAAVLAGLVPNSPDGKKRIKFVTEGEASALACLESGLGPSQLSVCLDNFILMINSFYNFLLR